MVVELDLESQDKSGNPTVWAASLGRWQVAGLTVHDVSVRVAAHLATKHPFKLVMVVDSGNKSLHCWFNVRDAESASLRAFMTEAAVLGADTKLFQTDQWARFPNGRRANGVAQPVVYFNPDACPSQEVSYGLFAPSVRSPIGHQ